MTDEKTIDDVLSHYLKNWDPNNVESPCLSAMKYFMDAYDNFEKSMNFIHVAGTNGKGSCTEMISNVLVKQGYKVGKYISPHLIKRNERISINNVLITDEQLEELEQELLSLARKYYFKTNNKITWFELETFIALLYFYRSEVDFVILEVGLGGLYDATNVITKPLISIVTSVGYDHMNILGDDLIDIAVQKAGIIKQDSNTIIFSQSEELDNLFEEITKQKNNKLRIIKNNQILNYSFDKEFQYFDYKNLKNITINLKGQAQVKNACIVIEAVDILNNLQVLKCDISEDDIKAALCSVVHKGRFEVLHERPLVIFDGAHNEPAIRNLRNVVSSYYNDYYRIYIISVLKRKDYLKIIELLLKDEEALFVFTSGNNTEKSHEYVAGDELYKVAKEYIVKYKLKSKICVNDLNLAIKCLVNDKCVLDQGYKNSTTKDIVAFIVGSFYVYKDVLNCLQ